MSLYAEMRKTRKGRLDNRAKPYRFRETLIKDGKNNSIPSYQKKITIFIKRF